MRTSVEPITSQVRANTSCVNGRPCLVDHLLREGEHDLACRLASEAGVELLTDVGVFAAGKATPSSHVRKT